MLPHLGDRCVTFRRFPNGVDGKSFFEKRCPSHRPDWVRRRRSAPATAAAASTTACSTTSPALVWAANLAALELHTPDVAQAADIEHADDGGVRPRPGPAGGDDRVRRGRRSTPRRARRASASRSSPRRRARRACSSTCRSTRPHTTSRPGRSPWPSAQVLAKHHPDRGRHRHEEGPAQGQGLHRLEPERRLQDDDLRLLAAGPPAPDGVDPGHLGRGRGRGRAASRCRSRPPTCSSGSTSTATCSPRPRPSSRSCRRPERPRMRPPAPGGPTSRSSVVRRWITSVARHARHARRPSDDAAGFRLPRTAAPPSRSPATTGRVTAS